VAGHDRGGRVAYRLALDHPDRVERLAVLDIVPTAEAWGRADARFALAFWPWSLLAQPAPLPERLLAAAPEAVVDHALGGWGSPPAVFGPEVRASVAGGSCAGQAIRPSDLPDHEFKIVAKLSAEAG
jgi:haloacetate dehalogenase